MFMANRATNVVIAQRRRCGTVLGLDLIVRGRHAVHRTLPLRLKRNQPRECTAQIGLRIRSSIGHQKCAACPRTLRGILTLCGDAK